MRFRFILPVIAAVVSAGCSGPVKDIFSDAVDGLHARNSPLRTNNRGSQRLATAGYPGAQFTGAQHVGSGSFVSHGGPAVASATPSGDGKGYELNLVNAPVAQAAKVVLGDALGVNYVVDPRVPRSVPPQSLTTPTATWSRTARARSPGTPPTGSNASPCRAARWSISSMARTGRGRKRARPSLRRFIRPPMSKSTITVPSPGRMPTPDIRIWM
jgi:hypothetical protein